MIKSSLCSCDPSQEPGEENLLREAFTTTIEEVSSSESLVSEETYTHPLDKTVIHQELPGLLMDDLRTLLYFEDISFPNGSNYKEQRLKTGSVVLPNFGEAKIWDYPRHFRVHIGWDVYIVDSGLYSRGPGMDLGMHFCTRDKYLKAFSEEV